MSRSWFQPRGVFAVCCAGLLTLGACATKPPASDPEALAYYKQKNDPIEPFNRAMLKFNTGLDKVVLRPITMTYRTVFPEFFRRMITNFIWNLRSPVYLANNVLQGDMAQAGVTIKRFAVNSTVGVGGLFDPARKWGLEHRSEDFGQTLGTWGAGEGVYIVLPVLGPSSLRDGFGFGVDILMDPLTWVLLDGDQQYLSYVRVGVEGVDLYERNIDTLDDLRETSLDYYSALRSYYRQLREGDIRNGAPAQDSIEEFDEFDDFDDFDDADDGGESQVQIKDGQTALLPRPRRGTAGN
ncbi:MAG: VacJ family lipoprotein [Sphingomonadales bacterium]